MDELNDANEPTVAERIIAYPRAGVARRADPPTAARRSHGSSGVGHEMLRNADLHVYRQSGRQE
jgi:hypothetical protein